ncbi:phage tail tape measure protein [Enterococcus faecalis]|uniref:phage tail tape measure protein n=1 Tax=Enterococcus faecalis TaxID=1351 RepID=UPI000CF34BE5|nr:phage tail tape measure protein [Enterococcus faecalis]EGO8857920.1 phage tail tape measure protein [Enterococcus faecalis]EJI7155000.1 phage tail tape measure protein [Enterococcus faecalis]PQG92708.1 phage tail tape measure protein [Enterococcus faecalis]RBR81785.1 phage tail tape measure protein, TP901 family, core region [Enterococcus faecalis]HBI1657135.1 phage tail tape measure protein [Enterococcus faecalis]
MSGGTPLGNMVIKLGLDSSDFGRGAANAKKEVRYLAKEMQANAKIADMAGNQMGKLGTRFDGLTKIIGAQEKQVAALKKAYDESFVDGKATESTKRLATQLQDANGKLANYRSQLIQTAGQMAEMQVKTTGATGAIYNASEKMISSGQKMEKVGGALTKGITLPILAGAAAVTTAAVKWESDFAGVKKTNDEVVDSTGKVVYSYKDLENGLRGLAKELPSSHTEIANVAEAAGQLGIKTKNVVGFTKTMIDLGESTNMSAEEAATALARLANITGMPQTEFDKLGSVIVDLGNNFATTESEITAMGLRLAGAGHQVGMSEAQIMGFAAALSSVGIEAEAGGSAFSKVMVEMQLAVENGANAFAGLESLSQQTGVSMEQVSSAVRNGGKELKNTAGAMGLTSKELKTMHKEATDASGKLNDFAEVAGMSAEQFSKAFKEDASGAIIKFIEGLGKTKEHGQSAIAVLDDMGITEVRLRDSLLRAAGASDVFKSAVDRGTKAWGENTALTEEANKRYETTESQLKMLKNEAVDVGITFGGPLVKALRDALQATKPMIKTVTNLAESFSNADPKTQQTIVKMIALTAAMGPAIKLTGTLTKGVGFLGKGFVETMAAMSKKRAIEDVTKAFAEGSSVSLGFGKDIASSGSALGGLTAKIGGTTTQIGSLTKGFSLLNPWVLGATVAIGAGVAVWKLWGEEAWNSSQRTQRWGTDVGKATDEALTKFQGYSRGASGELDLLEKGVSGNTDTIANNFSKMGQSIEENMTKKIETLKGIVNKLPDDIKEAGDKLTKEEVLNQEKYLDVVKENNQKITQIKQEASNNNRKISYEEAIRIKSLAKESAEAYVNSLGKSETETKEILSAMTGNVAEASEDQAKTWLQSLGKQRQQSKIEYTKMQDDLKAKLVDAGYDLNSKYAKEMLSLLKESGDSATQITEDQMSTILAKYPELADQVFLANGQLISSMGEAGQAAVGQNKKMMDSFTDMAEKVSKTAGENAKKIELIADEANEFGEFWNQLILDTKTGEVKTNAQEAVNEAASSEKGWNQLIYASKNADLKSNAKLMIAEAAIANGRWEKMTFTEQQALLDSNVTKTMTQALQAKGSWGKLNFEEKKAVLYSNTPEVMAETMLNLGLWKDYQPQVKELKAKNQSFLDVLSQSQDKIVHWSQVPVDIKEILGDNYDLLSKIYGSEQSYNRWKNLPDTEKKLLANNSDVLQKIMTSDTSLKQWNALPADQKKMLGDNTDLLTKVMASEESFNAWKALPDPVKKMLGNNEDLKAKIAEGSLSVETYNQVKPLLKQLLGDASNVSNQSQVGIQNLNAFNANNPAQKILRGDSSNAQAAARQGGNALNTYNANNPGTKNLRGNAGGVVGAASSGNSSLNIFAANNPVEKLLRANDQASGPASQAKNAVSDFNSGPSVITKTLNVVANLGAGVAKILGLETGTNNHIGGPAIVNDQKGRTYKELVIPKGGVPFIPEGRNVFLPDLPRGSKVIKASETKKLIPHYENGVGVPRNSSVVKNLIAVQDSHESNDFSELASLMREMVSYLKDGNIKNMEVTQYITGADSKTPRETAMETKRQLRDLARGFK